MAHKIIISIIGLLLSIGSFSQNFMFNQHYTLEESIGTSRLDLVGIRTAAPSNTSTVTFVAKDNVAYNSVGLKYIDINTWKTTMFRTGSEYTYYKALTEGTAQYNTYYRFMKYAPYRSIWNTNGLIAGALITITHNLYSSTQDTIHIGIIADNFFDLFVNGDTLAFTNKTYTNNAFFNCFNLFEVALKPGNNIISITATSDGSIQDALGFILLNNTQGELYDNPVAKTSWNVLACSENYVGTTLTIATCPNGYSFDSDNNYCYKIIDLNDLVTSDFVKISPVIDYNHIISPTSWTMTYGDGVSQSLSPINSTYSHAYTTAGTKAIKYTITQSGGLIKVLQRNIYIH